MSKVLTPSQADSIRRILETSSMPKLEIARRFNCSAQTIHRINREIQAKRTPTRERSADEVAAKRDFDAAFNAFERCSSPENYRRFDEARHVYETRFDRDNFLAVGARTEHERQTLD